jgi:hypothetical protein
MLIDVIYVNSVDGTSRIYDLHQERDLYFLVDRETNMIDDSNENRKDLIRDLSECWDSVTVMPVKFMPNSYKEVREKTEMPKEKTTLENALRQQCEEIIYLILAKNKDYGDSVQQGLNRYGDISLLVRLSDKFHRLNSLILDKELNVKNEKLEDTEKDMIGYLLLHLVNDKY